MNNEATYTYNLMRKCPCGQLLPDQYHKSIKYCPPFFDAYGKKIVHKDIYTSQAKKLKNQPYKFFFLHHKHTHRKLKELWKRKVPDNLHDSVIVTIEEINFCEINILRPAEIRQTPEKKTILYFIDFAFEQINATTFKLLKHGIQYK